jgi:hypothetical protein
MIVISLLEAGVHNMLYGGRYSSHRLYVGVVLRLETLLRSNVDFCLTYEVQVLIVAGFIAEAATGMYWVCDLRPTPEVGGGNCGHESTKSVDSSTVRMRKLCQELYDAYLHPKPSMTTTPPPLGRPCTGIHYLQEQVS